MTEAGWMDQRNRVGVRRRYIGANRRYIGVGRRCVGANRRYVGVGRRDIRAKRRCARASRRCVGVGMDVTTVTNEFTLFFKPLCQMVSRLLTKLGQLSTTNHILNYQAIRDILLEGFGTVEEDPNWSGVKDIHGYGLLQQDTKRKLPVCTTGGYEAVLDLEDEADSWVVHQRWLI